MPASNVFVIARREYLTRIRGKAFWIATLLLPLLLTVATLAPIALLARSKASERLVVVDGTERLGNELIAELEVPRLEDRVAEFEVVVESLHTDVAAQREELNRRVLAGEIDAWLWITPDALSTNKVEYHAENVANFLTQGVLDSLLSKAARNLRLRAEGLDPAVVQELTRSMDLETLRITPEGARSEGVGGGIFFAYILFFMLYLVLVIYGQQVMSAVLEEKTSRIVEIIVSTTRPFSLMLGKLLGICAVALTQLAIWLGVMATATLPGVVASLTWLPSEFKVPSLSPSLLLHTLAFFLIGFFVYATVYAAIGAAFNSPQEAQQFAGAAVFFLIAPLLLFYTVLNDPDSPLSVAASLFPPFTPLLMVLRLAVKSPPWWQVALGYVGAAAFALAMVWAAGRIYRVGILMTGKKPTIQELWRWLRHA